MSRKIVNCPYCGKILPREILPDLFEKKKLGIKCPRCDGEKIWKSGTRYTDLDMPIAVLLCKLWASFLKEIDVPFRLFQECVIHRQLAKMYLRELGMGIALPASGDVNLKPHFLFNLRRCVLEKGKG